jgi:hypothetical protein
MLIFLIQILLILFFKRFSKFANKVLYIYKMDI